MFLEIFLLDAAGNIKSEFIIKIPTHLIEIITTIAIITINKSSINLTLIPLLLASELFILIANNLLKLLTPISF